MSLGQLSLPITVTNHIDGFGGWRNDGITWLRVESGIRLGSQLIPGAHTHGRFTNAACATCVGRESRTRPPRRRPQGFSGDRSCEAEWSSPLSLVDIQVSKRRKRRERQADPVDCRDRSKRCCIGRRSSLGTDALSAMYTGATVTESTTPTKLSVTEATPGIRGPAPLPSEEQGLPG